MSVFLLLALFVGQVPELQFEAPSRLHAVRQRLESIDPAQFDRIVELVGPPVVDMPIRVVLAEEDSPWARGIPRWVAGFAVNASATVVIFPARTPVYPNANLEDVLRHEVAHILIHRAAHNAGVPRWFHEGLAMAAESRWWFGDQGRLVYQFTTGSQTGLDELDRQFTGTEQDQQRAYVLAGALIRDLLQRKSRTTPREILKRMAQGESFDSAFDAVVGRSPSAMASEFWERQGVWTFWLRIVFSVETLWLAITVLAIFTFRKRRRRNAEIEKRWAEEGNDGAGHDSGE
jgi:hypothetical protein